MKNLLLMRHAKSSWKDLSLIDHQRPLKKRGKKDAGRMGIHLKEKDIELNVILCSTAKRARMTVKWVLKEYDFSGDIYYVDDLYNSSYELYISVLNQLPADIESAMIIGHNQEMDHFLEIMCDVYEHMSTASIAVVKLSIEQWAELSEITPGELVSLWKPREI